MAIVTTSGNISALLDLNNNTLQPAADRLEEHLYNFAYSLDALSMALVYNEYYEVDLTPSLLKALIWYPESAEITAKGSGFLGSSGKVSQILYDGNLYNWNVTGNSSWSLSKGIYSATISSLTLWDDENSERFVINGKFTFNENGIRGTLSSSSIQYNGLLIEQSGSIKLTTQPSGKLSSIFYKDAQGSINISGSFVVNKANVTDTLGGLFDQADLFSGNDTFNVSDNSRAWYGFAGNDAMYGGDLDDELHGGSGNDLLDGGLGIDFMYGGKGNDTYIVDNTDDVVLEEANEGNDTVKSSVSHCLANHVENLILTGDASTNGTGNELKNSITGNLGNNFLDGGASVDKLAGGAGDDTYIVDLISKGKGTTAATLVLEDSIVEKASEGDDTLVLRIEASTLAQIQIDLEKASKTSTVTLAANLENLDASATGNIALNLIGHKNSKSLTGNKGNNILDAKGGAATLSGLAGDDTYIVYSRDDLTRIAEAEGQGNDTLQITFKGAVKGKEPTEIDLSIMANVESINVTGNGLFKLVGNAGDNRLSGNNSGTVLEGGAGDDTYVLNHKNDRIKEAGGSGIDTIETAKLTIKLADYANVEHVTLTGKAALNATGNELANVLTGNDGNNILDGGLNTIGFDTLRGGKGNDTYIVRNVGDLVEENGKEGTDTVKAHIDYSLTGNVENLILEGDSDLNGTGNALNNTITGNDGNNILDGGAGVDKLIGGKGDDTYIVDLVTKGSGAKATIALQDSITEKAREGTDTLQLGMSDEQLGEFAGKAAITLAANLENLDARDVTDKLNLSLTGNGENNIIWGNNGNNHINGGAGNDILYAGNGTENTLVGGAGADTMYGGDGRDTFAFTSVKDLGLGEGKQDVIYNFNSAQDTLDFKALKGWKLVEEFSNTKQLRYEITRDEVMIYGNSGGNTDADFSIKLVGVIGDFSGDNFIL